MNEIRWIRVEGKKDEKLLRVLFTEREGFVSIPNLGDLHYDLRSNHYSLEAKDSAYLLEVFQEGEILTRKASRVYQKPKKERSLRKESNFALTLAGILLTSTVVFSSVPAKSPVESAVANIPSAETIEPPQVQETTPQIPQAQIEALSNIQDGIKAEDIRPSPPETASGEAKTNTIEVKKEEVISQKAEESVLPEVKSLEKKEAPIKRKRSVKKVRTKNRPQMRVPSRISKADEMKVEEIKKAFLHGDLEKAQGLALALQEGGSQRIPPHAKGLLAEIEYAVCRKAFREERWLDAAKSCRKSQKLNQHENAQEILRDLELLAKKLYLEGYVMEMNNPEAARQRFEAVLSVAPRGNPYRAKAAEKLKRFK